MTTRLVLDSIDLDGGGRLVIEAESRPDLTGRLLVSVYGHPGHTAGSSFRILDISTRYWLLLMGVQLIHLDPPRFHFDMGGLRAALGRLPEPDVDE